MKKDVPFNPNVKDGRGTVGLAIPKSNWCNILDTPPYEAYAVTCGITFTFGGLKIDGSARVIDTDGQVIPGLYAAGELVGGLFYFNYPGGTGLMNGAVFGKIAGTAAGQRAQQQPDEPWLRSPLLAPGCACGTEETFDVVVVGGGGAGLAAALEARAPAAPWSCSRRTRSSAARPPGRSARSAPAPRRTSSPRASRTGPRITGATWPASTARSTSATTRDLRRVLADAMPDTFRWLLAHGIRFYGPMPEPPHRKPRMHNVLPNSRSFIAHLGRAARRARRRHPPVRRAPSRC